MLLGKIHHSSKCSAPLPYVPGNGRQSIKDSFGVERLRDVTVVFIPEFIKSCSIYGQ